MSTVEQPAPRSYVDGPLAPVTEEVTAFDLPVTGTLPDDLVGRYVRNGPNPIDPDPARQHWFTGAGMLHGVRLDGGRAAWYRNRWVRGRNVTDALGAPPLPGPVHAPEQGGAVNTSVVGIDGRTFAIVEAGSYPIEVTDELESICSNDFDGTLESSFTAHPHHDPRTGLWHAITYYWAEEAVRHVVVGPDAKVRQETVIPVGGRPMVHDTAITETRVLVFDLPCTFSLEAIAAGDPFPYAWNPTRDARVGILPLDGSPDDLVWVEVPRCYVFHPMNAFDLPDGRVVVDVVRWERMFDRDRLGPSEGPSVLERWTLDPATGTSTTARIDDRPQEFPRVDERLTGTPHRFGYSAGLAEPGGVHAPLYRHDLEAGTVDEIDFGPTSAAQEFVFVGRGSATAGAEDDGWLLGFVSDRAEGTTDLVVLAADAPADGPIARVHLPTRVPDGFHGNWLADRR